MLILLPVLTYLTFAVESGSIVEVHIPRNIEVPVGSPVEVCLSIDVAEGFHLQANPPSEETLIATELKLQPHPEVTIGSPVYPKSKPIRLQGSNSDLAVYDGTFEIAVPLEVAPRSDGGTISLKGQLHYQACDDERCFFPTSTPVELEIRAVEEGAPISNCERDAGSDHQE